MKSGHQRPAVERAAQFLQQDGNRLEGHHRIQEQNQLINSALAGKYNASAHLHVVEILVAPMRELLLR